MSAFWQGAACLYLIIGGGLMLLGMPRAWAGYRSNRPDGSALIFFMVSLIMALVWLVPLVKAWRRRG